MIAKFVAERSRASRNWNAHYHKCQKENRPFVHILPRRKYAFVEIDLITTDRFLDHAAIDKIEAVLTEYSVRPEKVWLPNNLSCAVDNVPISSAEIVANLIYDLAVEAMRHLPPLDCPKAA